MKQLYSPSILGCLVLAMLIASFAIALPSAHAASLHTPHTANTPTAPDRRCSLAACGVFTLDGTLLLIPFAAIILALIGSRFDPPLYVRLILDPPPRVIP